MSIVGQRDVQNQQSDLGKTPMETRAMKPQYPDVSAEQRASNELVKRIRKLRWMGMEKEAERIQTQLAMHRDPPADSVLAAPRETD